MRRTTKRGTQIITSLRVSCWLQMSELQAALGRVQLDRLEELIERKRTIFGWYADRLDGLGIALNFEREDDRATYWMNTVVFDRGTGVRADMVAAAMAAENIATRPFFSPLSSLLAYATSPDAARAADSNLVSYDLAERAINLPSGLTLTEAQVDRVCSVLRVLCARSTANTFHGRHSSVPAGFRRSIRRPLRSRPIAAANPAGLSPGDERR